ncbi:MAG: DUF1931 domain-containing protein [Candidatus Altiarchaeota archaeon]
MADNLIVKSAVKAAAGDMNVGADFYEKMNEIVSGLIGRAKERAKENGRTTLKARDA